MSSTPDVAARVDRRGVAAILLSAVGFGTMAIFAQYAKAEGANTLGLLFCRFLLAGGLLLLFAWPRVLALPRRTVWVAVGMGAIGYASQAASYFFALDFASAGLVALLLYFYPAIVTLLAAALLKEPITPWQVLLVALSFVGLAITVGGGSGETMGYVLGITKALIYSFYILIGAKYLDNADPLAVTTIVCLSAAVTMAFAMLWAPPAFPSSLKGWLAIAAIGLFGGAVAILCFFEALKRLGATRAAMLSTLEPIVTVVLAAVVLNQPITPLQLLGGLLIIGAAVGFATTKQRA